MSVKTHCNEIGFRNYGKSLVQETVKLEAQYKPKIFCCTIQMS